MTGPPTAPAAAPLVDGRLNARKNEKRAVAWARICSQGVGCARVVKSKSLNVLN